MIDPRKTPNAFLGNLGLAVEINLFVRTRSNTGAIALALFFIDQNDPVFRPLEDSIVRTGFNTGRLGTVAAHTWHVVVVRIGIFTAPLVLVPVHAPIAVAVSCDQL